VQREESDLPKYRYSAADASASVAALRKVLARREWWHWLAGALLAVMLLEWVIYHRRW